MSELGVRGDALGVGAEWHQDQKESVKQAGAEGLVEGGVKGPGGPQAQDWN